MSKVVKDLVNGWNLYPVWIHQAYHNLSSKYKRTILGTLWIAGNFVFTSLAITLVFGTIFHQDLKTFLPYSMLGNLVGSTCLWVFFEGPEMYIGYASIIKNHAYPFTYFSFESVTKVIFLFFHNLVVYYIFMAVSQNLVVPHWSAVPGLLVLTMALLTWGSVFGMLAARYRDLRFLLPSMATLLFFLTPIYWHMDLLGSRAWIATYNPLYNLVAIVREPLLGKLATMDNWIQSIGVTLLGFVVWLVFFGKFRRRIPFWV